MLCATKFISGRDIPDLSGNLGRSFSSLEAVTASEKTLRGSSPVTARQSTLGHATRLRPQMPSLRSKPPSRPSPLKSDKPEPDIHHIELDLASLDSVAKAAREFKSQSSRLDILMNKAGIMATPEGLTKDGYEIQFGTNHLGHALLTKLLLPVLERTQQLEGAEGDVRTINLTSWAQEWFAPADGLLLEDAKTKMDKIGLWQLYGHSKIANVYFTKGLAKRYPHIRSIAVHPGGVKTSLSKGVQPTQPVVVQGLMDVIRRLTFADVAEGARNQLWASTSPNAKPGLVYYPVAREQKERPILQDEKMADKLWDWTENELRRFSVVGK